MFARLEMTVQSGSRYTYRDNAWATTADLRKGIEIFEVMLVQRATWPCETDWVIFQQVIDYKACGPIRVETLETFEQYYQGVLL